MFHFWGKNYSEEDKKLLKLLRNILGCKPKNISVYKLALVHRSCSHKDQKGNKLNNERLEYLGDTVLSTIVGEFLFRKYPHKGESFLTEMRSKIVCRANLNKLSIKIGLSDLIKYSRTNAGEWHYVSMDGDAFEALVGALYVDKGYDFTYKALTQRLFNTFLNIDEIENSAWNYKGKIIAWGQKNKRNVSFEIINIDEINHRKQYTVQIRIDGVPTETATDFSVKSAEQLAAEKTYKRLMTPEQLPTESKSETTQNE